MFLGHYGVSFGAKRFAANVSLGTLILAAELLDLVLAILLLGGVEHAAVKPGLRPPRVWTSTPTLTATA